MAKVDWGKCVMANAFAKSRLVELKDSHELRTDMCEVRAALLEGKRLEQENIKLRTKENK